MTRTKARFLLYCAMLVGQAVLAGCSINVAKSAAERRLYVLEARRQGAAPSATVGGVLQIRSFRASPRFDGKKFVYRTGDWTYRTDYYNEFLASPRTILMEETQRWLASSGLFGQVLGPAAAAEADCFLEGTLVALYADYRDRSAPLAVLEMQVFLMDSVPGRFVVLFHKDYREEAPMEAPGPEALVEGWSEALSRILTALEKDLHEVRPGGREQ